MSIGQRPSRFPITPDVRPERTEMLHAVSEVLRSLERETKAANLMMLTYLISMARLEAERMAKEQ